MWKIWNISVDNGCCGYEMWVEINYYLSPYILIWSDYDLEFNVDHKDDTFRTFGCQIQRTFYFKVPSESQK